MCESTIDVTMPNGSVETLRCIHRGASVMDDDHGETHRATVFWGDDE